MGVELFLRGFPGCQPYFCDRAREISGRKGGRLYSVSVHE